MPEWPIAEVARATGLTSRTLRHYEQVGVLRPSRVAHNGYRFYGDAELARLYRIMSLRDVGLPLAEIRDLLTNELSLDEALREHLVQLEAQRDRTLAQIALVQQTFDLVTKGAEMSVEEVFRGFDHAGHEAEVRERWGDSAWEASEQRREGLDEALQHAELTQGIEINAALRDAAVMGADPAGETFQALVAAHHRWVTQEWGDRAPNSAAYAGLAEMYVADERFASVYGGVEAAGVIRDAIGVWIATNLTD